MLNNVGLRLQPCRTPTKGVKVAVNPLVVLLLPMKQLCYTCFSVEILSFEKMHISLAYGKGRFSKLCHRPLKVDKEGVYLLIIFRIKISSSLQNKNVVRRPIAFSENNLAVMYYIVFVKIFCKTVINN